MPVPDGRRTYDDRPVPVARDPTLTLSDMSQRTFGTLADGVRYLFYGLC